MKNLIKNHACNLLTINTFGDKLNISYLCISFFDILNQILENIIDEKFSQIIYTLKLKLNNMKKTFKVNIRKNSKGTSYFLTCNPLLINSIVYHHDIEWYINKLKNDFDNTECALKFSDYEDFWGKKMTV